MRNITITILVLSFIATTASAATIEMRWDRWPDRQKGYCGQINILISDLLPGDTIQMIAFDIHSSEIVGMHNPRTTLSGWSGGAMEGEFIHGTPFAISAQDAASVLDHTFSGIVGSFELYIPNVFGTTRAVTFDAAADVIGVRDASWGRLRWDARYHLSYSGYIAYGDFGNPGWGRYVAKGHQPTPNPLLFVDCIPESSSAVILILGGFGLMARARY